MNSFLGYHATFMLDTVVVSLIAVVPILLVGLLQAKAKNFKLHSRIMLFLGIILAAVVCLFEADMRINGGIFQIASRAGRKLFVEIPFFRTLLYFHLAFSVSCCFSWYWTLKNALKRFNFANPQPSPYGNTHRNSAYVTVSLTLLVVITGLWVYFQAFIRS